MDVAPAHYRSVGYMRGRLSFEFTEDATGKSHDEMIAALREFVTPDPEITLDLGIYADLFYCADQQVALLGTWVLTLGVSKEFETVWHAHGWDDRPVPSKEKALRFLQQLGRPA
jgi:hypothetical protein